MSSKFLDNFPSGAPSRCEKVNDFLTDEELTEFVVTAIAGGGASVIDTKKNGWMRIAALATTDDCGAEVQDDVAWIALEAGDTYDFETTIYLDESTSANVETQSDFFAGLATLDTSIIASAPTDGIYFRKDDGDANLDIVIRASGANVTESLAVATVASDTSYRLGIKVVMDSSVSTKGSVTFYVNGTDKGSVTVTGLPSGLMGRVAAFQTGDNTGTKWMDVDYLAVRQSR